MYPEYAILAFPYAKIKRIKLIMWYAHYQINWRLILASKLVDKVLTTSYETCRIRSNKVYPIVKALIPILFGYTLNIDYMILNRK